MRQIRAASTVSCKSQSIAQIINLSIFKGKKSMPRQYEKQAQALIRFSFFPFFSSFNHGFLFATITKCNSYVKFYISLNCRKTVDSRIHIYSFRELGYVSSSRWIWRKNQAGSKQQLLSLLLVYLSIFVLFFVFHFQSTFSFYFTTRQFIVFNKGLNVTLSILFLGR